jgi:hypothetical protein
MTKLVKGGLSLSKPAKLKHQYFSFIEILLSMIAEWLCLPSFPVG